MLIDVLNVELFGTEVEYIALVVGFHIVGIVESFQDLFFRPEQTLKVRGLIFDIVGLMRLSVELGWRGGLILSH